MKNTGVLRRDFIKGAATSAFSLAMTPALFQFKKFNIDLSQTTLVDRAKNELPPFLDCSMYIGPGFPSRPDFPKASNLLVHMERLGIERAIAWHTDARTQNPMEGNKLLLDEIESVNAKDRIIPSFILSPTISSDSGDTEEFLRLVKKNGIRAFHFFLNSSLTKSKFGWELPDIAPILRTIEHLKPVLFIDLRGSNLDQLMGFSEEFPQVSLVCGNCPQSGYQTLFEVMENRPNIYLDTSFMYLYQSIEYVINRFGVERLIFGTGYKSNNGASIAALAYVDISLEDSQLIAHGNLERILNIKEPLTGSRPIIGDRLWNKLLRKEHLGPEVIDAHSHLYSSSSGDRYYWCSECVDFDGFAEHAIHSMNVIGIKTMLIAGFHSPTWPSLKGNVYLEEHVVKYKKNFNGYLGFNPASENADILVSRLDDFFSRSFFIGFKLLNDYWKIPVTDSRFIPIWEFANTHRLPILVHTWQGRYDAPAMLTDIVRRYPDAIFILGHSGSNDRPDAEQLVVDNSNVYLEWCGSFYNPDDWSETLERVGNRKLLYGSDGLYHYPAYEMGRLLSLDVPDQTLIPILGKNMSEILDKRR